MSFIDYRDAELSLEGVACREIANAHGTPVYAYSAGAIRQAWQRLDQSLSAVPHQVCYAVKANSNLAVLQLLAKLGSGFDIVSGGELERVLLAGGDPHKVVFSGVGKTRAEMHRALEVGVLCFNVESASELDVLNQVAQERGVKAPVSVRVNPDVDAKTHPYISTGLKDNKFGIDWESAVAIYQRAHQLAGIEVTGIDCHIGSQLTELAPYEAALDRLLSLVAALSEQGIRLRHLDLGGGFGIQYRDESPILPEDYAEVILPKLKSTGLTLLVEPGRSIVGNAGVLITEVQYLKQNGDKHFAIVDAAINDLIRPALYQAWQNIVPVSASSQARPTLYDVVGPVCESTDFLGKERELAIVEGDLLAVMSSGAYCYGMTSNYNSRCRIPEVLIDGDQQQLVRRRERFDDLVAHESLLPDA